MRSLFETCIAVVGIFLAGLSGIRCQSGTERGVSIERLAVSSNVTMRFSEVSVQGTLLNTALTDKDTVFVVTLPKSAFITSFSIYINNEEYKAEVKEKTKAQKEYQKALKDDMTAGYVSQESTLSDDFDRDQFNIGLNIAPESSASFDLRYQELIERYGNVYKQKLYVNPQLSVSKLEVTFDITETKAFNLFEYRTPFEEEFVREDTSTRGTETRGYHTRKVQWTPSPEELQTYTFGEDDAFDIFYDLAPAPEGGEFVVNDNGQFAHFFSTGCEQENVIPKRIVFVIDVSGSMSKKPIAQVKGAMMLILDQLRTNEQFDIVLFSESNKFWKRAFVTATTENIEAAKEYLSRNLIADGATNVNDALLSALNLFTEAARVTDPQKERYGQIVVLLTDGSPTVGERDEYKIRENVREANYNVENERFASTVFTVAFGNEANKEFLWRLARDNGGVTKVIKEKGDEDNYLVLYDFFTDLENPYFMNVNFSFTMDDGTTLPKENTTQSLFPLFDCGGELIVSGWTNPQNQIRPHVVAEGLDRTVAFDSVEQIRVTDTQAAILDKLIVYKHIKELLEKLGKSLKEADEAMKEESKQEALSLALKHGLVTPITSMVITSYRAERKDAPPSNRMLTRTRTGWGGVTQPEINPFLNEDDFRPSDDVIPLNSCLGLRHNVLYVINSVVVVVLVVINGF